MKRFITIAFAVAISAANAQTPDSTSVKTVKSHQCKGITKSGQQCKKRIAEGKGDYCFIHRSKERKGDGK